MHCRVWSSADAESVLRPRYIGLPSQLCDRQYGHSFCERVDYAQEEGQALCLGVLLF